MRKNLQKSRLPKRRFQHAMGAKNPKRQNKQVWFSVGKRNFHKATMDRAELSSSGNPFMGEGKAVSAWLTVREPMVKDLYDWG